MAVCDHCNDTHLMGLGEREVMCTRCPTPCQRCRQGGNGPYCTTTPCPCECHGPKQHPPTDRDLLQRAAEALGAVLKRDGLLSPSGVENGCNCINYSRKFEREYEAGKCPHQAARSILSAIEARLKEMVG